MKQALIIFQKNPVYAKVKTRLAATVGNDKALLIYNQLIQHTHLVTHQFKADKIVFYSDEIVLNDVWKNDYQKHLQKGSDLGERMMNAFTHVFNQKYLKAVIIGTDCAELTSEVITNAFKKLDASDIVIGPAADGGYYLLAMKMMYQHLFTNIQWSTNTVLQATIDRCKQDHLSYFLLEELHDIDEEKDLRYLKTVNH